MLSSFLIRLSSNELPSVFLKIYFEFDVAFSAWMKHKSWFLLIRSEMKLSANPHPTATIITLATISTTTIMSATFLGADVILMITIEF